MGTLNKYLDAAAVEEALDKGVAAYSQAEENKTDILKVESSLKTIEDTEIYEFENTEVNSTGYYAILDVALTSDDVYKIEIIPTKLLTDVKIQVGTSSGISYMVDTLAENVSIDNTHPFVSDFYKPTGTYSYVRISVPDEGASVKVYKLAKPNELRNRIAEIESSNIRINSDITSLANALLPKADEQPMMSNGYYSILSPALDTSFLYRIKIVPSKTLTNVTVQTGTASSSSAMVDTIASGVSFDENNPFVSNLYTPSGEYSYIRISEPDVDATVIVYKLSNTESTPVDVTELLGKHVVDDYGVTLSSTELTNGEVTLGTGWSGTKTEGFTHAVGNTDNLVFQTDALNGIYKLTFRITSSDTSKSGCSGIKIIVGGSKGFDIYEGNYTDHTYTFGIQASGSSKITIVPEKAFAGTIHDLSCREIISKAKSSHILSDDDENICFEIKANYADNSLSIGRDNMTNAVGGNGNVAVGVEAMEENSTGFWNTAIGNMALQANTVGSRNIAIGYIALQHNITGNRNIAIGTFALNSCTHGIHNIGIGADAMQFLTTGENNIGLGVGALAQVAGGKHNIALGNGALIGATGNNNICFGRLAGDNITTGNDNIIIGYMADAPVPTGQHQIVIGSADYYDGTVTIAGRKLIFNQDGSVTWESVT